MTTIAVRTMGDRYGKSWRWTIDLSCGHRTERVWSPGDEIEVGDPMPCPKCVGAARDASTKRVTPDAGWTSGKRQTACRWCRGPLPKRRMSFCSDECVHEHKVRSQPGYARHLVFQRDRGVCKLCGLDTGRIDAIRLKWRHRAVGPQGARLDPRRRWDGRQNADDRLFELLGLSHPKGRPSLWEMDHEKPVVEGGGACGLENLRTLCVWCHKGETAKLRRRLAGPRSAGG